VTTPAQKLPPINLWTYRQALALALWLALADLAPPPVEPQS
jgi:hypothetical protein